MKIIFTYNFNRYVRKSPVNILEIWQRLSGRVKMHIEHIKKVDPVVAEQIEKEFERQQNTIELIASENITSEAVMEACGSVLTNK